jgi:hypothetical protein
MLDRDTVISIHEAGHAVIARALALHCGAATMADGRGRANYQDTTDDSPSSSPTWRALLPSMF